MPIYEYECSHCRYYLEVIQKLSDARLKKCPSCGKNALKKLISAPVFRLNGSGWYETDFKGDSEQKRNLAGGDKDDGAGIAKDGKEVKDAKDDKDAKAAVPDASADAKSDAAGDGKSSPKTEPKASAPADAPAKSTRARKSRAAKPAPKGAPSKRATRKSPVRAGKRRGRR
jgi:putative FmdB family regulatory protein